MMMKSGIDYGKIVAIGLIGILTTAIVSTSALNTFSEEEDDEEETSGKSGKSVSAEEDDDEQEDENDDEQEEEHDEKTETATETEGTEIEVKGEIIGNSTQVKVEIEFTTNSTNKESLLKEITTKVRLDNVTVSKLLELETEEEEEDEGYDESKEELKVKVEIEDGKAEVGIEYRFMVNSTETDEIVAAIVDKLQNLELNEDDIELKVESKAKPETKHELKVKAVEKIAEKAKEAAEKKGKPEFVENIGNAEKFFGKTSKAVVALKIGLESDDIESMSFGSAQLILIKIGDKETMFRAVVNILTDQTVDTLTACLDGDPIGELTIVHASEELGLSIGHLRETLTGSSITVPGVTVDIVQGTDCNGTAMLSGTI